MRTLKTLAAAAALLMVAASANAAIILTVTEDLGDPTAFQDFQVDITFSGIPGGGIGGLQFSVLSNGALQTGSTVGAGWGSMGFLGSGGGGNDHAWGDFAAGPVSGSYTAILKFALVGATGDVDLNLFLAYDDSFSDIASLVSSVPFTIIPEPTTAALLGLGLFGLALGGRRR